MPQTLYALELTLWTRATRFDRALMDQTFAADFYEFGRSGRRYTRDQLLFDAAQAHDIDARLHDFAVRLLSPGIAQATYVSEVRSATQTQWANRSSLWDRSTGHWRLRFHQGTALPPQILPPQPVPGDGRLLP